MEYKGSKQFTTSRIKMVTFSVYVFLERVKSYFIDKISNTSNSKIGNTVISNVLNFLLINQDFQLANIAIT